MSSRPAVDWRLPLALIFVQVTFGGFHVIGKFVLGQLHPFAVAGVRVAAATPLLMLIAWLIDRKLPKIKDIPLLILLGSLGVFANQFFYILGLKYTSATHTGILMPTIPVFAAAAAVFFKVESLDRNKMLGVACTVAGSLVMMDFQHVSIAQNMFLGNMLLLINCMSFALYLVLQKPLLKRLPPLTVTAWSFLFGGSMTICITGRRIVELLSADLSPAIIWSLVYVVMIATVLNYFLNSWAVGRSSPSMVSAFITLQPVSTAVLAMFILGENPGYREGLGFLIIICGLFLVGIRQRVSELTPVSLAPAIDECSHN